MDVSIETVTLSVIKSLVALHKAIAIAQVYSSGMPLVCFSFTKCKSHKSSAQVRGELLILAHNFPVAIFTTSALYIKSHIDLKQLFSLFINYALSTVDLKDASISHMITNSFKWGVINVMLKCRMNRMDFRWIMNHIFPRAISDDGSHIGYWKNGKFWWDSGYGTGTTTTWYLFS